MPNVPLGALRVALVPVCLVSGTASAQAPAPAPTPSSPPAFNTIRTPTSPAFTLLGAEPASVERPNTPSSLAVSLLSRSRDLKTVPSDFAVEFSPYWLFGHPRLEWKDDDRRTIGQSIARTATLSVATAQTGTEDLPVTGLAVGARATLWSGRLSQQTRDSLEQLEKKLQAESALALDLMAEQLKAFAALLQAGKITQEEHNRLMDLALRTTLKSEQYRDSAAVRAVEKHMASLAVNREGFFLEVAGAAGWSYPRAVWADGRFARWGAWVTPSYQKAHVSATGVLRYLSKDGELDTKALDVGIRGTYSSDRYALSLEYVNRSFPDADADYRHRLVGIAEYQVAGDTWLVASFGRDHATEREGSLLARLGLSFNFSQKRHDFDGKGTP